MGESGAGKTTLLNTLTMKNQGSLTVTGQVSVNNLPATDRMMASISAYIQQDKLFVGALTVKEQLIFYARLRMDYNITKSQMLNRIEDIITELGLSKCQDTVIGIVGSIKGISGGEAQRLSLACELLSNPSLMICDEPTSGLDSVMAQQIMKILQNLAREGKTVICSIHQPSSQIYDMFDKILFLTEGRVAYSGTKEGAMDFFKKLNFNCPSNYNPADYFIHILSVNEHEEIYNSFKKSDYFKLIESEIVSNEKVYRAKLLAVKSRYKVPWFHQMKALLWRSSITIYRESNLVKTKLYQIFLLCIVLGLLFYHQDLTQLNINNINASMQVIISSITYENIFCVLNVFCFERSIFLQEYSNGMYRADVYFLSKILAEQPISIATPFLLATITYWLIGLYQNLGKFFIASSTLILVANAARSYGYLISSLTSSTAVAFAIGSSSILPFLLFSGFFLSKATIPWFLRWMPYFSWFKYGYETLVINQWVDVTHIDCNVNNRTCPENGLVILQSFGFKPNEFLLNIILLFVLILSMRLIAILIFSIRSYKNR